MNSQIGIQANLRGSYWNRLEKRKYLEIDCCGDQHLYELSFRGLNEDDLEVENKLSRIMYQSLTDMIKSQLPTPQSLELTFGRDQLSH